MLRACALVLPAMVLPWVGSAQAFDPAGVDILDLRLGMTEATVHAILLRQGVDPTRITRQQRPDPDTPCDVVLTAPTRDGILTITLAAGNIPPERNVVQVRYALTAHGPGEPKLIASSIMERFGRPDQMEPLAWCAAPIARECRVDQPRLRFLPDVPALVIESERVVACPELSAGLPRP